MFKRTISMALVGLLAGCAGGPVLTQLPADHPANPNAPAAAYAPPPNVLEEHPPSSPSYPPQSGMKGMNMGHMKMNHDMKMDGMDMNHMNMGQSPKQDAGHGDASARQVLYTCPMHPNITATKPGQCPICGMTLVLKTNTGPAKERSEP